MYVCLYAEDIVIGHRNWTRNAVHHCIDWHSKQRLFKINSFSFINIQQEQHEGNSIGSSRLENCDKENNFNYSKENMKNKLDPIRGKTNTTKRASLVTS